MTRGNQRIHMRFDKVIPVVVFSELYGEVRGVARNMSAGGMLVEMMEPLPLASVVTIEFHMPDCSGAIVARAEVKHHYCFNFGAGDEASSSRGIGLRFLEFVKECAQQYEDSFTRHRVLH